VKTSIQKIRGAAIMLALWALFLLSALVISWALDINSRLSVSSEGTRILKAEALACSGAEVALNPTTKPGSPNLNGQLNGGATYHTQLTGEGGRIDINWVVSRPETVELLRRYLENKGIDLNERDLMIDALQDWVSPNAGLHRLNAPPETDDYHPAHAPIGRIDELKKIAGWAEFTSVPGWDDDFTVNTRTGVDLLWASRDVLLAISPVLTPEMVDRFLQIRQGPDGVEGTEDDTPIATGDIPGILGLTQQLYAKLQPLLAPSMPVPVFRVVSVGTAGKAKRTVQMVFSRVGVMPQVLAWSEF
jgi:Type II secretion system (T2SS), protein K